MKMMRIAHGCVLAIATVEMLKDPDFSRQARSSFDRIFQSDYDDDENDARSAELGDSPVAFVVERIRQSIEPRRSLLSTSVFASMSASSEPMSDEQHLLHAFDSDYTSSRLQSPDAFAEMLVRLQTQLVAELQRAEENGDNGSARFVAHKSELLWRLARALYNQSQELCAGDHQKRRGLVDRAYECAQQALALDNRNAAIRKWAGITLSEKTVGAKESIEQSFVVREHFEAAAELDPADAMGPHLLGIWAYTVADLPWLHRKVASALFATPPDATYEQALDAFMCAEQRQPRFYSKNTLMIAKCHRQLGNDDEVRVWLERTLAMPVGSADDQKSFEEATKMLDSM
jgi:tetratricopeptide (TPR) repeat protein